MSTGIRNRPGRRSTSTGCVGILTLPFTLASRALRPTREDRLTDRGIEAAQLARTAIAISATIWLLYAYPLRGSAKEFAEGKLLESLLSAGILLVAGSIALTAFVLAARPPWRSVYRRRLISPLLAFGVLLGGAAFNWLVIMKGAGTGLTSQLGWGLQLVALPLLLATSLFALPFFITAVVLSVHHMFRVADVHEVLPPLLSPVLVWSMFVFQLFDSSPIAAPAWVRALFLIGAPLSVTTLSIWELRRLRMHFGVTLRGALNRGSTST
ncbi:hypothetical protein [Streptomyces sp. NPDC006691]|uniref:hypothetical protein n=1 Tax=Streptomyces sp. NPDC006691 TaxID=3364757 RepID=UPI003690D0E2